MANKKKQNYQYISLADLKPGVHNVFGVVKFSKVPVKSRGTDFIQVLSITDESLPDGDKLVISLFYKNIKDFPSVCVGDVIRFHRLLVESVQGELKGRPASGFSWLFVHEDVDKPCVSSLTFTITDHHKKRVRELQQWAGCQSLIQNRSSHNNLSSLVPMQYCDLVCQVIATCMVEEDICFMARIWDGTRCSLPLAPAAKEMEKVDYGLEERAAELAVNVCIYDNHVPSCQAIQPGQYIKLCNLHVAAYKGDVVAATDNPTLELAIHRGTAFGRGVVLLDSNSPQAAAVKERIETFVPDEPSSEDSLEVSCSTPIRKTQQCGTPAQQLTGTSQAVSASRSKDVSSEKSHKGQCEPDPAAGVDCVGKVVAAQAGCSHWADNDRSQLQTAAVTSSSTDPDSAAASSPKRICSHAVSSTLPDDVVVASVSRKKNRISSNDSSFPDNELGGMSSSSSSGCMNQPSLQSSTETCMLQTASVISGHHHISRTPICQVLAHKVPGKFRVLAHLVDFHPNTVDPAELLQWLCPKCFLLRKGSGDDNSTTSASEQKSSSRDQISKSLTSSLTRLAGLLGGSFANWRPERLEPPDNTHVCPHCSTDCEPVYMELIYMLKMVLQDSHGDLLVANLWRDQAVKFFHDAKPEVVLKDKDRCCELVQCLRSLCLPQQQQPQTVTPPRLDCCLFSYSTKAGLHFQIFDTVLV